MGNTGLVSLLKFLDKQNDQEHILLVNTAVLNLQPGEHVSSLSFLNLSYIRLSSASLRPVPLASNKQPSGVRESVPPGKVTGQSPQARKLASHCLLLFPAFLSLLLFLSLTRNRLI